MDMSIEDEERQTREWYEIYDLILTEMEKFGVEDADERADFWVDTDNFGTLQHKIYVHNIDLLKPAVVTSLQGVLRRYPSWEVVYAVAAMGQGQTWPDMWLTIRASEVLDALQRSFLPAEYRNLHYAGGRPLTADEWAYYGPDQKRDR